MVFKKGKSGNPKGRPKKVNDIGRYIRMRLGKLPKGKDKRYIYYVVSAMLQKGIAESDIQSIKELLDRAYGKSKETIDMTMRGKFNVYRPDRLETTSKTDADTKKK